MEEGVKTSASVVLFLSEGVLARPFVLTRPYEFPFALNQILVLARGDRPPEVLTWSILPRTTLPRLPRLVRPRRD